MGINIKKIGKKIQRRGRKTETKIFAAVLQRPLLDFRPRSTGPNTHHGQVLRPHGKQRQTWRACPYISIRANKSGPKRHLPRPTSKKATPAGLLDTVEGKPICESDSTSHFACKPVQPATAPSAIRRKSALRRAIQRSTVRIFPHSARLMHRFDHANTLPKLQRTTVKATDSKKKKIRGISDK